MEKITAEDFNSLLKSNKKFAKAWDELNVFFSGAIVSQELSNEIEDHLKSLIASPAQSNNQQL